VTEFLCDFPEISVALYLTDRRVDLVAEKFDLAIRVGKLPDSSLVTKLIGKSVYRLVASPNYLKKNGTPMDPEDLSSHNCLRYSSSDGGVKSQWPLKQGRLTKEFTVSGQLISDQFSTLREAAIEGLGIARLPSLYVREHLRSGSLTAILNGMSPPETPINLIHPAGRNLPRSTRSFIDFVYPRLVKVFEE